MNWVVCLKNTGYEASLEPRKLYNVQDDPKAASAGMLRVVDESQGSYLVAHAKAPQAKQCVDLTLKAVARNL